MIDFLVAWAWRFTAFRFLVCCGVAQGHSTWLSRWCAEETPFLLSMRAMLLAQGELDLAAECSRELRRLKRL